MTDDDLRAAIALAGSVVDCGVPVGTFQAVTLIAERLAIGLLAANAEIERMRAVYEAALLWRTQLMELPNKHIIDTNDGSCEPGLARPSARVALLNAIDASRAERE